MSDSLSKALLLASLSVFCLGESDLAVAQSNGVLREVYGGIGGTSVADLTNNAAFPDNPTTVGVVSDFFEAPTDVDDNYGQRMSAYVIPPTTGNYVFWIASDDNSTLFLSTDDTAARKRVIASVPGATASREWAKYAQQRFWITQATTGIAEQPQDFLVINEIMYNPAVPDAAFIEIYNRSTLTAFDVSNCGSLWRLKGEFQFVTVPVVSAADGQSSRPFPEKIGSVGDV